MVFRKCCFLRILFTMWDSWGNLFYHLTVPHKKGSKIREFSDILLTPQIRNILWFGYFIPTGSCWVCTEAAHIFQAFTSVYLRRDSFRPQCLTKGVCVRSENPRSALYYSIRLSRCYRQTLVYYNIPTEHRDERWCISQAVSRRHLTHFPTAENSL